MANSLKLYVDPNNANPSRLSRLPNAMRFDSRQELYALNIGAKSWQDFEAQIQAEAIGDRILLSELAEFDAENDPDNILGNRCVQKRLLPFRWPIRHWQIVTVHADVDELGTRPHHVWHPSGTVFRIDSVEQPDGAALRLTVKSLNS